MQANLHQELKIRQLEDELGVKHETLKVDGLSEGYLFTSVNGVTVLITQTSRNPRGGYKVPALAVYAEVGSPTNLDAAVRARQYFDEQPGGHIGKYGHLGPRISLEWKCGNQYCPCQQEDYERRVSRGIGRPFRRKNS